MLDQRRSIASDTAVRAAGISQVCGSGNSLPFGGGGSPLHLIRGQEVFGGRTSAFSAVGREVLETFGKQLLTIIALAPQGVAAGTYPSVHYARG